MSNQPMKQSPSDTQSQNRNSQSGQGQSGQQGSQFGQKDEKAQKDMASLKQGGMKNATESHNGRSSSTQEDDSANN